MNKNKVKSFFDNAAINPKIKKQMNAGMVPPSSFFEDYREKQEINNFNQLIDLNNIKNVLEVACGSGRWSFYLSNKVNYIKAIDISPQMIEIAKGISKKMNITNIDFEIGEFFDLDLSKKYDLIYFSGLFNYLEDYEIISILTRVKEISNSNTIILTRDTISKNERIEYDTKYFQSIYRTSHEMVELFNKKEFIHTQTMLAYKMPLYSDYISNFYKPPIFNINFVLILNSFLILKNHFHFTKNKNLITRGNNDGFEHVFNKFILR